MRVLVCGGRDYQQFAIISFVLSAIHKDLAVSCLIEGGATGADRIAGIWADKKAVKHERYDADWRTHGKAAGPIRNKRMLEEGKPDLVVAFPGHSGTANMVMQAQQAGVKVMDLRE